ncbi:MAG: type II toxin-antitoxin system VapC family toxin [Myxococcales bacterium]
MIVVDTTVLVYAVGAQHDLREPCRRLVRAVSEGVIEASTTSEVIQEFAHVRARRRGRLDAVRLSTDYAELLAPLLTVSIADLHAGLKLFEREEQLGAFDAILVASAAARKATAVVSADGAFAAAREVRHVFPDDQGVAQLLDT